MKNFGYIIILSILISCQSSNTNKPYEGYLFTYFEGQGNREMQEQLRFAISMDAIHWHALNDNKPIIDSEIISQSGGIRDPHILRKEDQSGFFMVATDMFTMKNGWDSNPGIILMKSSNLIDWDHSWIDLENTYPEAFKNVKWVWAPQTIYDHVAGKYLVYFTVRFHHNEKLDFYGAYAKEDFTGLESVPVLMFSPKYGGIDGDIVFKDDYYHFFFKGNTKDENGIEVKNGIQRAKSKSLFGIWQEDFEYIDAYSEQPIVVEGSSIFKLNNENEYILMYDLYANQRYEFQRSKDLEKFSKETESFVKDFHPRHGSVISLTKNELALLKSKWGKHIQFSNSKNNNE
ncbi:glycoside hydrolase family 43 protein [Belliella sp. DSM 111904]|uniref:Glycoside hydrolase family 43 protein n=1 Tax=Belliella filtrata TaxID=2923435 RepID=A0ABS9V3V0_9BACT|nr:glycoside hydrolase family 43 protein [Belliella filtrata]MCH7411086.1 glycoside hydrolase family 43 protein [Belliella filtrata]